MRAVIQRVREARVEVQGRVVGRIERGVLALVGAGAGDEDADVDYIVKKIADLRIHADEQGRMNQALADVGGAVLVVSQFTLYGDARRGRRPSFTAALEPEAATRRVDEVVAGLRARGLVVETGEFGAMMDVHLLNDGPVTILLDSRKAF